MDQLITNFLTAAIATNHVMWDLMLHKESDDINNHKILAIIGLGI